MVYPFQRVVVAAIEMTGPSLPGFEVRIDDGRVCPDGKGRL
jgi:hypothetical protein